MRRLVTAALALAALGLALLANAAPVAAAPTQLWPGVTYERGVQFTPNGPVAISILRGPRPGGLTTLEPLLSNETLLGRETLTAMQRRLAASATTAGVNGDFFTLATGRPSGVLMRDGVMLSQPKTARSSAGISSDGRLDVRRVGFFGTWAGLDAKHPLETFNSAPAPGQAALFTDAYGDATPPIPGSTAVVLFPFPAAVPNTDLAATVALARAGGSSVPIPIGGAVLVGRGPQATTMATEAIGGATITIRLQLRPDWPGIVAAIGGGPQIVRSGAPVFRAGEAFTTKQLAPREPRTAVGQTADGSILLVTVDGRQPGLSVGLTNFELAQTLVRLGAVTGMALDGGGSTTMAFDGAILNSPSERERPISTALVLAYGGVFVPAGPELVSPNGDGVADDPRLSVRSVRPATVTTRLVAPDGRVFETTAEREPGSLAVAFPPPVSSGATAPPPGEPVLGTWTLEASAIDDLGRTSTMSRTFVLDDTLGFLRVGRRYATGPDAKPLEVGFRLARPARVTLRIESAVGVTVRALPPVALGVGPQTLAWDGKTRKGQPAGPGRYVVRVVATGPVGQSDLAATILVRRA